jgi:cell cycle serine/threonine-protein kinase CDC5/MSD2
MPQNSVLEQLDINRQAQRDNVKPKEKTKQKLSALCKTPPSLIRNKHGKDFQRGSCLGEGGFARCFQVKDDAGMLFAAKTVAKASITAEKTRSKLLTEISIHRSVRHPNIIRFVDCFEDETNVYILLEYCSNQSLMELIRRRKKLTEPDVRFFIIQVIGAVSYLHSKRVLPRDLKLGNIMLDEHMNVKIGDFGLATVLASDRDRRKTVCGTPNYIAPEILYDKTNGHSYEADIWSIGIIIYAMLYGKPPFQSKNVETIYKRIKTTDYEFPDDVEVSAEAQDLITCLLTREPNKRLTLDGILTHPFFKGTFPRIITTASLTRVPSFKGMTREKSRQNFIECQINCQLLTRAANGTSLVAGRARASKALNPLEVTKVAVEAERSEHILPTSISPASTKEKYKMVMVREDDVPGKLLISQKLEHEKRRMEDFDERLKKRTGSQESVTSNDAKLKRRTELERYQIFVVRWVDFSEKNGFGYQLSNGRFGAILTNGTVLLKDPSTGTCVSYKYVNDRWTNKLLTPGSRRDDKLIRYLDFFENYMSDRLAGALDDDDMARLTHPETEMFLTDYERTEDYMMFAFNNDACQYNFPDHAKMVFLCQPGSDKVNYVNFLDPSKKLHGWPIDEALQVSKDAETNVTELSGFDLKAKLDMTLTRGDNMD